MNALITFYLMASGGVVFDERLQALHPCVCEAPYRGYSCEIEQLPSNPENRVLVVRNQMGQPAPGQVKIMCPRR